MERHRMAEHTRYERLYGLFLAYAALLALFGLIMTLLSIFSAACPPSSLQRTL